MSAEEQIEFKIWKQSDEPGVFVGLGDTVFNFSEMAFITLANKFYMAAQRLIETFDPETMEEEHRN